MGAKIEYVRLDASAPWPAREIAALHMAYLPGSFVSQLGRDFAERFYYGAMAQAGLIVGHVAYVDGRLGGISIFTEYPDRFIGMGARRMWARLGWVLAITALKDPRRLATMWRVWRLSRMDAEEELDEALCDDMTKVILPEFSEAAFKAENESISNGLTLCNLLWMLERGKIRSRSVVEIDNEKSRVRIESRGYVLKKILQSGRTKPSNLYEIRIEDHLVIRRWRESRGSEGLSE